ncbi:MAG: hypothetical protein V4722_17990 [Bacteroidota bacterium]
MKRLFQVLLVILTVSFLVSCARGISPFQAANGKARCGNYLK